MKSILIEHKNIYFILFKTISHIAFLLFSFFPPIPYTTHMLRLYLNKRCYNNPLPLCNTIITKKTFVTTTRLSNNVDDQNDSFNYLDQDPNKSSKIQRFIRRETRKLEKNLYDTFNYQNVILKEMNSRLFENLISVPEKVGRYMYYDKFQHPDDNFPTYCRCNEENFKNDVNDIVASSNIDEQIVLNVNQIGDIKISNEEIDYIHIGSMKVSLDHSFLAFTLATTAEEYFHLCIRDINNEKTYYNVINDITSCEWSDCKLTYDGDGNRIHQYHMYYTISNQLGRPYQVWRQNMYISSSSNECKIIDDKKLIFEENDEQFFIELQRTKDSKFITISSNSKTTSEVSVISTKYYDDDDDDDKNNMNDIDNRVRCISNRRNGKEYYIDHVDHYFYIIHTVDNKYKISILKDVDFFLNKDDEMVESSSTSAKWKDVGVNVDNETEIEDIDVMKEYCAIFERKRGKPQIRVFQHDNPENIHHIPLPEEIGNVLPGINQDYDGKHLRITMTSPLAPEIVCDYNVLNKNVHILRQNEIAGTPKFNREDYEIYQSFVKSEDGNAEIPMTIVHSKSIERDSNNPVLLHGYGAYGVNVEVDFQADVLSLLNRGWIVAYAHVRGGSELGKQWYLQGKGLNKKNSFHDYASCAMHLIDQKWTNPELLCGHGMSAGGLLLGAVANMYPGLFKAMVMKVPFTDPYSSMCDPTLPLTIHEYDEWGGNPLIDTNVHDYILSYSPYQNIKDQIYPSMLITGSTIDNRVPPSHPMKFIEKVRKCKTNDDALMLLSMQNEYGHFGQGGRYGHLEDSALEYAFLTKVLGLDYY